MPIFTAVFSAIGAAFTAVSSFLGSGTLLAGIGGALLKAVISVGISLLQQALAGKPKKPGFSVQGKLQAGGDVPRSILLGNCATAGSLVYANAWGKAGDSPNAFLTQVICLADMPVQGLWGLWVNGEKCTILWEEPDNDGKGFPVEEYRREGRDYLWLHWFDGTQTAAPAFLTETVARPDDGRPYESNRIGTGCPYVVMTSLVHEELWTGFPAYKFELAGLKLYDVSKDSSAGGDGDQRWDDPETWGGDGDFLPAVQMYNLLRGVTFDGAWLYGLQGVTAARLPAADWIAAIEKCRLGVDGLDGPEPQYRSGGEIQVGAPLADAIEAIATACAGRPAEVGGVYTLHVGAPGEAAFTISDADIISTDEQSFTPFFGLDSTVNGVQARYPNPGEAWNIKTAPALYRPDLEALDGGRRLMADPTLDMVPYPAQVQRLQLSALEEARRFRRHTIVLPPDFWAKAVPNGFFAWNSIRNSYETKLFRIEGAVDKANLDVVVDCTEVDPADYDPPEVYIPPVNVPPVIVRPSPQVIVDWNASGVLLEGDNGSLRPAILLEWDGDQADIDGVEWEVKLDGDPDDELVHNGSTSNYEVGKAVITQAIIQETAYEVRGRYVSTASGRPHDWSAWLEVTTPSAPAVAAPSDILNGLIDYEKLSAAFQSILAERAQTVMRVRDEMREIEDRLGAAQATHQGETYQQVSLVKVANENAFGAILQESQVRLSETSALLTSLNALVAVVENPTTGLAALGSVVTAQGIDIQNNADGISILVTDYTALEARVTTAEGNVAANASSISAQTARVDSLKNAVTGTAQAGSSSTITLAAGSSAVTNYYVGLPVTITSGQGAGQTRYITAYNGSTKVATVNSNWGTNPSNTSVYAIGNGATSFAMASQLNTVETTVGANTASITTLQSSYNGLAVQYGIVGDIDGATGGMIIRGAKKLDESVEYDIIFSASRMTVANLSNLIRNGDFSDQGLVNPAAAYDIIGWYINTGAAQLDVVAGTDPTNDLPTQFGLKLSLSGNFLFYNDYNPAGTDKQKHGIPVENGQEFRMEMLGVADASRTISIQMYILDPSGTFASSGSAWTPSFGTSVSKVSHDFAANADGRAYFRIQRSSTAGTVWLTSIECFRRHAADLLVDGTVTASKLASDSVETEKLVANSVITKKINGLAVNHPMFDEVATGADDKTGTGLGASYASVHTFADFGIRVPNGETVTVYVMWTAVLEFTGAGGWDFRMDIAGDTDNARIYAPSGAAQQYFVTMTGAGEFTSATDGDQTLGVDIKWKGESTVKVRRRNVYVCFVKR